MIVWLLVLLLLISFTYVVYQINHTTQVDDSEGFEDEHHYTFKL